MSSDPVIAPLLYIRAIDVRTCKSWKCFKLRASKVAFIAGKARASLVNFTSRQSKLAHYCHTCNNSTYIFVARHILYHLTPPKTSSIRSTISYISAPRSEAGASGANCPPCKSTTSPSAHSPSRAVSVAQVTACAIIDMAVRLSLGTSIWQSGSH